MLKISVVILKPLSLFSYTNNERKTQSPNWLNLIIVSDVFLNIHQRKFPSSH